jgi:hypothetical protein
VLAAREKLQNRHLAGRETLMMTTGGSPAKMAGTGLNQSIRKG